MNMGKITRARVTQVLNLVCEAFMYHQIAMHRRPVYRHKYGDFAIDRTSLAGFIDTHLQENGMSDAMRLNRYLRILDTSEMEKAPRGFFVNWGAIPTLKPRGIQWISACLNRFGEMLEDMGPEEVARQLGADMQW